MHGVEGAAVVDVDHPIPELGCGVDERHEPIPPRDVDQRRDRTDVDCDLAHRRRHRLGVGDIETDADVAVTGQAIRDLGRCGRVEIDDHHGAARSREATTHRCADRSRSARHDRDIPIPGVHNDRLTRTTAG